ncbi:hypothetical protein NC653_026899 [Populus alba x Populus x berolinensis]|uniref:Uncharacterized protein n=1 Tax=Populus alba x Populus x berolinensis TaxID=444605 RepID=A0AAD6Q4G1_9ROSI|nr:hypothetical protein NC653_026899 [Populus alba x Populus x berolinensis]
MKLVVSPKENSKIQVFKQKTTSSPPFPLWSLRGTIPCLSGFWLAVSGVEQHVQIGQFKSNCRRVIFAKM